MALQPLSKKFSTVSANFPNLDTTSDKDIGKMLMDDLGFSVQQTRDLNRILALTNPSAALAQRTLELQKVISGPVTDYYKSSYRNLLTSGVPTTTANQLAIQQAEALYKSEVAMLDLVKYPGLKEMAFGIGDKMSEKIGIPSIPAGTVTNVTAKEITGV